MAGREEHLHLRRFLAAAVREACRPVQVVAARVAQPVVGVRMPREVQGRMPLAVTGVAQGVSEVLVQAVVTAERVAAPT